MTQAWEDMRAEYGTRDNSTESYDDFLTRLQRESDTLLEVWKWLNQEVSEVKQILEEQRDSSLGVPTYEGSPRWKGFPYLHTMEGKLECAEALLRKIDEWENK